MKQTGEKTYANQQLENKNDVGSRWSRAVHAAGRLQRGDGLSHTPELRPENYDQVGEMDEKTRRKRKATMLGKLSVAVSVERDEAEELPYTSKALEQQHW